MGELFGKMASKKLVSLRLSEEEIKEIKELGISVSNLVRIGLRIAKHFGSNKVFNKIALLEELESKLIELNSRVKELEGLDKYLKSIIKTQESGKVLISKLDNEIESLTQLSAKLNSLLNKYNTAYKNAVQQYFIKCVSEAYNLLEINKHKLEELATTPELVDVSKNNAKALNLLKEALKLVQS